MSNQPAADASSRTESGIKMSKTDDILHEALYASAAASDAIVTGSGDSVRKFADEKYKAPHVCDFKLVAVGERTDRLKFVCSLMRCSCGKTYYL